MNAITAWYYLTGVLGMKRSDVLICSYPRAGTTWLRTILCNYLFIQERDGRAVDLHIMDPTMPALGTHNLLQSWEFTCLPRFVKTHARYSAAFARPRRVLYVLRDPRDIMVSYYHYLAKSRLRRFSGAFSQFLKSQNYGLTSFLRHYYSWKEHVTSYVRYEELKEDAFKVMKTTFDVLEIEHLPEVLCEAVNRSTLESMKQIQGEHGFAFSGRFDVDFRPVREGKSRQWPDYFSGDDAEYYSQTCRTYGFSSYAD